MSDVSNSDIKCLEKELVGQTLTNFTLYGVYATKSEYYPDDYVVINQKANIYRIPMKLSEEDKSKKTTTKKTKKEKITYHYYVELEKTEELVNFLKLHESVGIIFENTLGKSKSVYQIFLLNEEDCPDDSKIYLGASSYKKKIAIEANSTIREYNFYLEQIKINPLYLMNKL